MSNDGAILKGENLRKVFPVGRGVRALWDVSLAVEEGEFVVVAGPSGCGKSTLLNLLGGLDRPTHGEVILQGTRYSTLSENGLAKIRRYNMGFVFQFFNLLSDLNARENVAFPMRLVGTPPEEIESRSEELLKSVGMLDRAGHLPSELSGGEQQRIAVARALANSPAVLLADEPTGNLDSGNSREIMDLFQRFNERGQTTVVVTHSARAQEYADRVVHLRDGEIQEVEERQL